MCGDGGGGGGEGACEAAYEAGGSAMGAAAGAALTGGNLMRMRSSAPPSGGAVGSIAGDVCGSAEATIPESGRSAVTAVPESFRQTASSS